MNERSEIILRLINMNDLLRSPDSPDRKRTLKSDADEFIVEEAEVFLRKILMTVEVLLSLSEIKYKDTIGSQA